MWGFFVVFMMFRLKTVNSLKIKLFHIFYDQSSHTLSIAPNMDSGYIENKTITYALYKSICVKVINMGQLLFSQKEMVLSNICFLLMYFNLLQAFNGCLVLLGLTTKPQKERRCPESIRNHFQCTVVAFL